MLPVEEEESVEEEEEALPPKVYDLIIIGAGPAGLTAAIYAGRAALDTLVFTGSLPGGQPANTEHVENFPGFPEGIGGMELVQHFQKQAENFGPELRMETVTEVDFSSRPFSVRTHSGTYLAETVILATGAVPRRLGVPGEEKFFGRGVSACATCDGFFYRGKRVAVIGGGDSAVNEAIVLTKFADEVILIHRRDELRATQIYQDRAFDNPKIDIEWDTVVEEVLGEKSVTGVRVRNVKTGETQVIDLDGVFVYVGMDPKTDVFADQIELDEWGYVVTDDRMQTNVPGVFAAGDVQDHLYRQIVVATGTGAIAAMEAEKFLGEYPRPEIEREMRIEEVEE
jgi:thioredoxin reductase (NADPH)